MSSHLLKLCAASALGLAAGAAPAQAATLLGVFGGTDCTGKFSDCFATQTGTNIADGLKKSSVVAKFNGSETDGVLAPFQLSEVSSHFGSVTGGEFTVSFGAGNVVSFTYAPGAGDPALHYFAIKQGRQYALFYDAAPILSGSVDMDTVGFAAGTDSFSHISFFNSTAVPEPGTWAMMILGFGLMGAGMRGRRAPLIGRLT
jgi:hypothetical protein